MSAMAILRPLSVSQTHSSWNVLQLPCYAVQPFHW